MEQGRIERTFTLAPGAVPNVVARIPAGTLQIAGEQRDDVAVTVTVHPADALARDVEVILEEQGTTILAEVRSRGRGDSLLGWLHGGLHNLRITMEIRTPIRGNIEAEAASANVSLAGIEGTHRVRTASGDVRVERLSPSVVLQTASGDIRAHALSGHVRIQTASGDLNLERGEGDFVVQTASGDVLLDQISGVMEATTASGDCQVRSSALTTCKARTASGDLQVTTPLAPDGEYEFSTVSGDLLLLVPQETRMTVAMKTVSGDLSCALPSSSDGGKRNRTLIVNGGGIPVRVKSVSGDCTIRAASSNLPPLPAATARPMAQPPTPPAPPVPPAPSAFGAAPGTHGEAAESGFSETLSVLQAVERGELTIDEAMEKLAALEAGTQSAPASPEHGATP